MRPETASVGPVVGRTAALWPALVAASLALAAALLRLRGVDLPAQVYRVGLFRREGLTLWDSQWYGGHWTLNYSVLFPPLAGVLGLRLTQAASAGVAALAFDRLATGHFGRSARAGSLVFAVGTLAQVAIGQLPFLMGEALALSALWAATRGRWRLAIALGVATAGASPLAGAFLALLAASWLVAVWPVRRRCLAALAAGAGAPVVLLALLFPGQGVMPFPGDRLVWLLVVCGATALAIPARERVLRTGAALYVAAIVASFLVPTALGGNVSRLGACAGAPLLVCVAWSGRRMLLIPLVVLLATLQWAPAMGAFTSNREDPSTHAAYFRPLTAFLARHASPAGRVEVVPTRLHWEAADVAPETALARGWERQLDTADNQLFYADRRLTAGRYRAWLLDNGVRYVALPDVPLDYAAVQEARLLRRGVPGLRLVWRTAHWRVFAVSGSRGLLVGSARLVALDGSDVVVAVTRPGRILLRVRYTPRWALTEGRGRVGPAPSGWTLVEAASAGPLRLTVGQPLDTW